MINHFAKILKILEITKINWQYREITQIVETWGVHRKKYMRI